MVADLSHQQLSLYSYLFLLSSIIPSQNVLGSRNNDGEEGISYVTLGDGVVCADVFDNNQCLFMQKAINVVIDKYESRIQDAENKISEMRENEKRLTDIYESRIKDAEKTIRQNRNQIKNIQTEAFQNIEEISSKFQDRFELKHIEMDRKYKRLQKQILERSSKENEGRNIASHFRNDTDPSISHSANFHTFSQGGDVNRFNGINRKQNHGDDIWKNEDLMEKENVGNITKNYTYDGSEKFPKTAGTVRKRQDKWLNPEKWKFIGNLIYDLVISATDDEKEHEDKSQSRQFPDTYEQTYEYHYQNHGGYQNAAGYENTDQDPDASYEHTATTYYDNYGYDPNPSVKAVFGKLKTLMKKGYNKLIQYKSGEATEKQDIDDIAPAIDSFYTQAAQFITTNTGAISFVATAGAVSNLGFNAYQQDTINDILDDITAKGYQIDSILSKVTELEANMDSVGAVVAATSTLASDNRKRHTNTDSSIGSICALMDTLMGSGITSTTSITAKSCCFVTHTDSVVGNFMTCLSNTALSASSFFSKGTVGACDTSTDSCGSLAPE